MALGLTFFRTVLRRLSPAEVDNNFQTLLEMFTGSGGMIGKRTQADLYADLAHADNTPAIVVLDTDVTKNGIYIKNGASGAGSWDFAVDWVTAKDTTGPLAIAMSDVSITIDMTAKTIVGGSGVITHKRGIVSLDAAQNVAFDYTSATSLMYLYTTLTGELAISVYPAVPPAGSVVIGYLYAQKFYGNDPAGKIRVIPTAYNVAGGYTDRWWTYIGGLITVNQATYTISTAAAGGVLFSKTGLVTIPGNQAVSYSFTNVGQVGYLFAHPTTGALMMTDLAALPPVGFPIIGAVYNQKFYSITPADFIAYVASSGIGVRNYGLVQDLEPMATVLDEGAIAVNLSAKTLTTTGAGLIVHRGGYTSIGTGQNVSFTLASPDLLLYVYADKTSGVLAAVTAPGQPPANSAPIAYIYKQKLYARDIFGKISLVNGSGAPVYAADPLTLAQLTEDCAIAIDLTAKTIVTSATGLVLHRDGYLTIPNSQNVSFVMASPDLLLFVYADKTSGVLAAVAAPSLPPAHTVPIAYIYRQKIYAADPHNRITLYNALGTRIYAGTIFDELRQRFILPDDFYFLPATPLTIYKAPCFADYRIQIMKQLNLWLDTKGSSIADRFQPVNESLKIDPAQLGSSCELVFRHDDNPDVRYIKPITKHVAGASALDSRALNMLVMGDSLTEGGMATAFKTNLEAQGATITPVGTYFSSLTNNLRGEGRGYWTYRSFVGKDNYSVGIGAHTRSSGGKTDTTKFENPFLKLADATDKANHPTWCFRFTGVDRELSYQDDADKTGNFYIFDFAWYLAQHSVANPDFITIALSTNDINLDRTEYSQAERLQFARLALEIMVTQIKAALPDVVIGIIPAPAWSSTATGDPRWADETAAWVENCMTDVATLQGTYTDLYIVPVWPFMNEDCAYAYASATDLSAINNTQKKTITDWVHFDATGRLQYAEVVGNWAACVV
jgi:lysophospholipase L1-like esterase